MNTELISNLSKHHAHIPWQSAPPIESSALSVGTIGGLILSAFLGGLFAAYWSNFFESRRRIRDLRRDKYYDHRNSIVQIEHEIIPIRINLSRNINSLEVGIEDTNENNIRIILRLYKLFLSSGLNLKILNVDLINAYLDLYVILESINSDVQYLEGIVSNIRDSYRVGKVDESLISMYVLITKQLHKTCKKADKMSLILLSKCRVAIHKDDKEIIKSYITNGGEISYSISEKEITKENEKTTSQELRPYTEGEDREQFVAPYMDLRRIPT